MFPLNNLARKEFNFVAISSFLGPKLECIELLISLHDGRHLFVLVFL